MTTTLTEFVDALAATITSGTGITRAHKLAPDGTVVFPAAFIHPPAVAPSTLSDDVLQVNVTVSVFVSAVIGENAETLLAFQDLSGAQSIPAALQANRNLGLSDVDARVMSSRPLNLTEVQAYNAFGAAFDIRATIG